MLSPRISLGSRPSGSRESPGVRWRELDATCCFVDISGFTALSERLARRGRIGAEELTEALNHVFGAHARHRLRQGRQPPEVRRRRALLLFSGDDHAVLGPRRRGVAMRAALREARTLPTSVGRVNLRMSAGIHSGTFHFFLRRRVAPRAPRRAVRPRARPRAWKHGADAGEIVVSDATAARLPTGASGAARATAVLLTAAQGRRTAVPVRRRSAAPTHADARTARSRVALREHLRERRRRARAPHGERRVRALHGRRRRSSRARAPTRPPTRSHELVTAVQQAADAEPASRSSPPTSTRTAARSSSPRASRVAR